MFSKIPARPFPFFNAVIRPVWRVMNTLIILIAFFIPWLSSYKIIGICTSAPDMRTTPTVATVKDTNKTVVITVKNWYNVPQAGVKVTAYAGDNCNNVYEIRETDATGQATFFMLPLGNYRFYGGGKFYADIKNFDKTYNGFEFVGLVWWQTQLFVKFIGLLGGIEVCAVAIFSMYARRIAFVPLMIGAISIIIMVIIMIAPAIGFWLVPRGSLNTLNVDSLIIQFFSYGFITISKVINTWPIFIGPLSIGIYALVSLIAIVSRYARRTAFFPLVISAIGMIMIANFTGSPSAGRLFSGSGNYLYTLIGFGGYWFTWVGLVSGAVIEFIDSGDSWLTWIGLVFRNMAAKIILVTFASFAGAIILVWAFWWAAMLRLQNPLLSLFSVTPLISVVIPIVFVGGLLIAKFQEKKEQQASKRFSKRKMKRTSDSKL